MAGKHLQKQSNKPLVILIIVAIIVIAAIVAGVIFFMNGGMSMFKGEEQQTTAPAAATTSVIPESTAAQQEQSETKAEDENEQSAPTEAETGVAPQESKIDVVVPMDDGVELTYFNASFIPNGKVEDTTSGQSVTLREAFGQSASDGVLTFNSDGTFRDTLISGEHNQGAYVVQNHIIHATYTNDKNMIIDVVEWDGDTPVRFTVLYGDFLVYFGKGD